MCFGVKNPLVRRHFLPPAYSPLQPIFAGPLRYPLRYKHIVPEERRLPRIRQGVRRNIEDRPPSADQRKMKCDGDPLS